jgi:hypothetical protein
MRASMKVGEVPDVLTDEDPPGVSTAACAVGSITPNAANIKKMTTNFFMEGNSWNE